jgi:NAD(P)-dependent dehydrogenase (short-subunit alcohol dehydrogenase family)
MEKTIVLITGCSSGIGRALLSHFDREPYRIVATTLPNSANAFDGDPIAQNPRFWIRSLDIGDHKKASQVVSDTAKRWGAIDILINNAGISYRSVVEDMTIEDEQHQMLVNYLGPMHLIRECIPAMRERKSGRIINVSSVGGMMAMPTMASYSASKFALEGASEALWYELKPWNIHTTLVRPGFINSLAFRKVLYSKKRQAQSQPSPYDSHYKNMARFVEKLMAMSPCTSESVAKSIFKVARMKKPPLRVAGTTDARIFYFIRRLLPRALYHKLLYVTLPGIRHWGR